MAKELQWLTISKLYVIYQTTWSLMTFVDLSQSVWLLFGCWYDTIRYDRRD